MPEQTAIIKAIISQGMLPLFYHEDPVTCEQTVQALYDGGVRIIEFTNRGVNALANFKQLIKSRNEKWPGLLLAIGTIKTPSDASRFIEAGADFIICPGTVKEVGETVHQAGKLWIPGCMTVSEILLAQATGAKFIKLFPGNLLGPGFMSGIRDIFPELHFMPTGGVELTPENLQQWFGSGVAAVGLGSKFLSKEVLEKKDYQSITELSVSALAMIATVKQSIR